MCKSVLSKAGSDKNPRIYGHPLSFTAIVALGSEHPTMLQMLIVTLTVVRSLVCVKVAMSTDIANVGANCAAAARIRHPCLLRWQQWTRRDHAGYLDENLSFGEHAFAAQLVSTN
jgi:hypothetical protein